MTRVDTLHGPQQRPCHRLRPITDTTPSSLPTLPTQQPLRDSVTTAVRSYLDELDGQLSTDVYQMVLS